MRSELFGLNGIHSSWSAFAESKYVFLEALYQNTKTQDICPERRNVLRFMQTDLKKAKIVILGQDPYPQKGAATGRAFEVGGLKSWLEPFRQSSLKNILRLIHTSRTGNSIGWQELKGKIAAGAFRVLPPDRLFSSWEEQGVLLLNTSFTCRAGAPMSHTRLWQPFTKDLIDYIAKEKPDLIWFLWGRNAGRAVPAVSGKRYVSNHPMLCGGKGADDFLRNPCFLETREIISWTGRE